MPTVAKFEKDIAGSLRIQEPLHGHGYESGLMIVVLGGKTGVTDDAAIQYQHLQPYAEAYSDKPIVTMLSNMPIDQIDFLNQPDQAVAHVQAGIEFAKDLPLGGRRIVTFHLNSFVTSDVYAEQNSQCWRNEFHRRIKPALQNIAEYAAHNGVELKVETVPIPEFGDLSVDDRSYLGVALNELRNPFYITQAWGFEQLKDAGIGICLDVCHSRTIYDVAHSDDTEQVLLAGDATRLQEYSILDDARSLEDTDLVHLNDGAGRYSRQGDVFKEGLALGTGDVTELPELIETFQEKNVPCVLEVNETDYVERPNARASIEYLLARE